MLAMIPNLGDRGPPNFSALKELHMRTLGRITFGETPYELTGQQRVIKERGNQQRRKNWKKKNKARTRCATTLLDVPDDGGESESEAEAEYQPVEAPWGDDAEIEEDEGRRDD